MMTKEYNWRKKPVLIKFEHLNPALQDMIGRKGMSFREWNSSLAIRAQRQGKAIFEGLPLTVLISIGASFGWGMSGVATIGGLPILVSARRAIAKSIQDRHEDLVSAMKKFGILQTKFEGNYPRDWINPTIVANTHPIVHVKGNGDLVFLRATRAEYARYVFQKSFAGKLGLNPWRWRAYLEPPTAPKPIRAWAKQWAAELAESLVPRRKPAFAMTGAGRTHAVRRKEPRRRI